MRFLQKNNNNMTIQWASLLEAIPTQFYSSHPLDQGVTREVVIPTIKENEENVRGPGPGTSSSPTRVVLASIRGVWVPSLHHFAFSFSQVSAGLTRKPSVSLRARLGPHSVTPQRTRWYPGVLISFVSLVSLVSLGSGVLVDTMD